MQQPGAQPKQADTMQPRADGSVAAADLCWSRSDCIASSNSMLEIIYLNSLSESQSKESMHGMLIS